jgi:hypothetical protein
MGDSENPHSQKRDPYRQSPLTVVAQFLVDRVQFIAAIPLDVRLTGEEERKFLARTRTLAELRIISNRRNDGIYHLRVSLLSKFGYKCCDCVVLPWTRNRTATEIDAVEKEHTCNDCAAQ